MFTTRYLPEWGPFFQPTSLNRSNSLCFSLADWELHPTHIKSTSRRERILFLGALAHVLLTLLGESGERAGLDRGLKASTVKKRTLSLYRQGCYWYQAIPAMDDQRLGLLMNHFDQVVREQRLFSEIFGPI